MRLLLKKVDSHLLAMNRDSLFKINELFSHIEISKVYKVIGVNKGKFQFFYKLETEEAIKIDASYDKSVLVINI
jgi:hypothetical protein